MILDLENIARIKNTLRFKPKGMNISDISRQLRLNRNSVAKYLEILTIAGEVESHPYGTSKIFTISQHVPVSAMLQFSSDMILMIAHDGRIIQANDQFLELAGTTRDLVIGKHYSQTGIGLLPDLPIHEFLEEESGKKSEIFEKTVKNHDKELFLRIKLVRTLFDDGKNGLTLIIDDISERILAELALAERENLYHSVIKNIQDVFYRSDCNGTLIMASPNWATILGYDSLDECIGKNIADVFYINPEKRKALIEAVFKKGSVHDYDVVLKKKDGTPLPVATNSHLYYDAAGNVLGIEGIFRDIAERQLATEKIRKYVSNIEFLSQKLREFLILPENEDIFGKIVQDLSELIPDAFIVVNSFDPQASIVRVRSVLPFQDRTICNRILGRDIQELELPISPLAFNNLRTGLLQKNNISLHEAAFKALARDQCEQIEQELRLGENYTIGFADGGALFGNAGIFLRKGATIPDFHLTEAYARQAAIALQRRAAEHALRESEELFYQVAQMLPYPLGIIDKLGNYRFINPSFTQLFGYDLADFHSGREWFMVIFPDATYRKEAISLWKSDIALFSSQGTVPREFTVHCKDGSKKQVIFRMMYLSTKEKCIICQDMTETRKAEYVQHLLSSIVTSSDDAIIGKDPNGVVLSWNPAAERVYGYPAQEIIGQSITKIIPHHKLAEFNAIIADVRLGKGVKNLETQRIRRDGVTVHVSLTISPILNEDGSISGISTISHDISSKKAEERLSESEERFRSLVENIDVGVYRSTGDPKGKFIWGNPSLVEILGYPSLDQLQKIRVADIFIEDNGREKHLNELKRDGFVKNKEISLKRSDGSIIWVSVTALAQFDTEGKIEFINGIVEDITQQKQMSHEIDTLRTEFFETVDFFPDAVCIVDTQKRVVVWNPAMERLTGVLRLNILGSTGYASAFPFFTTPHPALIDLIDEPDEKIRQYYPDAQHEGRSLVAEVFAPLLNGGTGAYLQMKATQFLDPQGNRRGAVEIIRDITDRKNLETCLTYGVLNKEESSPESTGFSVKGMNNATALSAGYPLVSSLYLYTALKKNPDCVAILDSAGNCLWANDAWLSLLQETGGDDGIPGNHIAHTIAPEFRKITLSGLADARKDGYKRLPIMLFSRTGRIPADVTISVIPDVNNILQGFMVIARTKKI